jgi:hypothetical protein
MTTADGWTYVALRSRVLRSRSMLWWRATAALRAALLRKRWQRTQQH